MNSYNRMYVLGDAKTALSLLMYLFLENHHIPEESSILFDSVMVMIKANSGSSGMNFHFNAFGKPNISFARFVIDFLSMSLAFNTFVGHKSLVAPVPYSKQELSRDEEDILRHNQKVLISFCWEQRSNVADKFFRNKHGDFGWPIRSLNGLYSTSTNYLRMKNVGILCFHTDNVVDPEESGKKRLWIHFLVILQLFHPLFRCVPFKDPELQFSNDRYVEMLHLMTKEEVATYAMMHSGENPNFVYMWKGSGGQLK